MIIIFLYGILYSTVISQTDISIIDSLLSNKNLSLEDLNFEKDWASSTKLKLPIVVKILNNPLYFPVFVDSVKTLLNKNKFALSKFSELLSLNLSIKKEKKQNLNLSSDDIVNFVYDTYSKAFLHHQLAFIGLNRNEKKQLQYLSYQMLSEDKDSTKYKNFFNNHHITKFDSLDSKQIIKLFYKINFEELYYSGWMIYNGFNQLTEALKNGDYNSLEDLDIETRFGRFIISTKHQDDIYTQKDVAFLLDLYGDDTYKTESSTDFLHPFVIHIDLSGSDRYISDMIGGLFSVRFGCLAHLDYEGNDYYSGDDYTLSTFAGFLFSYDLSGDDTYRGGLHSLGAATYGISYVYDQFGDDIYSATEYALGFASTMGIGILQDDFGDEVYFCGGKYLHAPLAPNDFRTMSHGYGFGLRPDMGGGIGILYDKNGNDYYDGGVFSLGGAYWYALGILMDDNGNDFYNSVYYPQGSGIHLAGGFLYDGNGEDEYYSKHGPGMGAGHDYSVGFLVECGGNDNYYVEGGLGLGLTNSVGIFIDKNGDDKYLSKYSKNCGWANKSRDTGGIGIFIDESGKDEYSNDYAKNNSYWQRGFFGFALDKEIQKKNKKNKKENKNRQSVFVDSLLPIKEIFSIASGWGVNSNAKRVDKALKILVSRDEESAKYIAENKMNTKSGLVYRAIKKYALKSKKLKNYFPELLQSSDSLVIKNTISLIGVLKDSTYLEEFKTFLNNKKYEKAVLSALGNIKTKKSVELLSEYVTNKNEKYRIIVARSLFKINNDMAKRELERLRKDKSFLIKAMFMIREQKEKN